MPKNCFVGDFVVYFVSNPRSAIDFPTGYNWAVARQVGTYWDLEDAFKTKRDAVYYAKVNSVPPIEAD